MKTEVFKDILGQNEAITILSGYLEKDKIPNSFLFYGPEGTGKLKTALKFANALTGQDNLSFSSDLILIDKEESLIKIEEIQELIRILGLKPDRSLRKVCIINNADKMTKESFNCLLKTLEEPPPFTHIILITSRPNDIPSTIYSRCIKIKFNRLSFETLKIIIKNTDVEQDKIEELVKLADGSAGKLYELIESKKHERILQLFNRTKSLWENSAKLPLAEYLRCAEELKETGNEARLIFGKLLDILILYWHERLIACIEKDNGSKEAEFINKIQRIMSILFSMRQDLESNINVNMAYSYLLLEVRNILERE